MKIAPAQQDSFLKAPDKAIRAVLLYGPDEGLVRSRAMQLMLHYMGKNPDPINRVEISAESLGEDPARLADELGSYSLMGGNRAVLLRGAGNDALSVIESAVMGEPSPAWPLIVTGGDLRPTSKLRKAFEKEPILAAIACYRDEARKLTQVLAEGFRERGISCEQGVIPLLANSLGNDRGITLQEIEKIDLYLGEKERHLSMQVAQLLAGDNREQTLDELFHAICGGEAKKLEAQLQRCFRDNMQPIAIFRMLSSHLQKLLSIQTMIAAGAAQKAAFTRHGVFFKQEPLIAKQIQRWRPAALKRAITALLEAEQSTKRGTVPAETTCQHLLHKLARYG